MNDDPYYIRVLIEMKTMPDAIAVLAQHKFESTRNWKLDTLRNKQIVDFEIVFAPLDEPADFVDTPYYDLVAALCQNVWDAGGQADFYIMDPAVPDPAFGVAGWLQSDWEPVRKDK